jgi:hypothetical protein
MEVKYEFINKCNTQAIIMKYLNKLHWIYQSRVYEYFNVN